MFIDFADIEAFKQLMYDSYSRGCLIAAKSEDNRPNIVDITLYHRQECKYPFPSRDGIIYVSSNNSPSIYDGTRVGLSYECDFMFRKDFSKIWDSVVQKIEVERRVPILLFGSAGEFNK